MTRPKGRPVLWATDGNFSDSGKPWHTTPTKREPTAGEIAAGYYPDRRRPAVIDNWKEYDAGRRLRHLDLSEGLNFPYVRPAAGSSGNVAGQMAREQFRPNGHGRLLLANRGDDLLVSIDGGYSWASEINVATSEWWGVRTLTNRSALAVFESGGAGRWTVLGADDLTWSGATAFTGATMARVVVPDPYDLCWWIGGELSGTGPGIWQLTDTEGVSGTMVEDTYHPTSGNNDPIYWIAAGPDYKLACNYDGVGGTDLYRFQAGDANAGAPITGPFDSSEIRALLWLPEDAVFLMLSHQTGGSYGRTNVAISADGETWDALANMADFETAVYGAEAIGSTIVVAGELEGVPMVAVSGDAGDSWEYYPSPTDEGGDVARVHDLGNQLAVTGYAGGGNILSAFGLRFRQS